jgi:hypothetical protein
MAGKYCSLCVGGQQTEVKVEVSVIVKACGRFQIQ